MAYQPTDWEHGDIITGGKLNKIEQELTHVADNATYGFGGAQLSSDGLTPLSYINAGDPMPANPQKGDTVFLEDGNDFLIYSYNGEDWVIKVDPDLSNRIEETIKTASDNTDKAIADNNDQINNTVNEVAQEKVDLAIKDADFINKAQAMADEALADAKANTAMVASKSLGTYLVRLLPGTNIFKTTNSTTIQAQVWKAGQDITSTLDNASFSWKLAKDGANAISLTNNVKNITAKPSDFTNTGTYIVNVIIPVTDTTGTTRNQTFSDSTTIAKVTDGVNGTDGQNGTDGAPGQKGADGKTTYVHIAYADSVNGSIGFSTTDNVDKLYIGVLTDEVQQDSTDYTQYTWSLFKGKDGVDGADGTPGKAGVDGRTPYVHFAYANSSDGRTDFSTTVYSGKTYLGTLTDTTVADSTDPTRYTWSLIKGADGKNGTDGQNGTDGAPGAKGADGRTSYVHVAYANNSDGTSGFSTTDATGKGYIGVYTDFTVADSSTPSVYTWSLVKGQDGAQGIPGKPGVDGRTPYLHTAWTNMMLVATENNSFTLSKNAIVRFGLDDNWIYKTFDAGTYTASSSTFGGDPYHGMGKVAEVVSDFSVDQSANKAYLGTYTDFTAADSSTPSVYTWSLFKGQDGQDGSDGIQGPKGADGISTYVHFAYANSSDGRTSFSVTDPTGRAYVGTLTDTTVADSTDPTRYTWSLIKGADGKNGSDGNGISSTTITYATSASGTNAPTSGYNSTIPTVNKGQFLWQRTATSYTNGTIKNSDVVTYFAKDGLNGFDGMDGGQGMIAQPSKPTSGLVDGFLWLDTSQTYPAYYIYDSSIKDFKIYQFNAKNINADQIKAKFVGTDRLSASQIIADDLRVKSANIDGQMTASQITVSSTNGAQTSLANFNLGEMSQTISDTKKAVNNLGQINQLFNTEFSPDFQGWTAGSNPTNANPVTTEFTLMGTDGFGSNVVSHKGGGDWINSAPITVTAGMSLSFSSRLSVPKTVTSGTPVALYIMAYNATNSRVLSQGYNIPTDQLTSTPTTFKYENIVMPSGAVKAFAVYAWNVTDEVYISQPMMVFSDNIGAYVQGNYNNNAALAQVKVTADGVSSIVSDPTTGLSTRVQTAEGTLSKVQGIDIPALQNATFWQPYSSLNFNDYTKQGSFFFNTTAAKQNGPTTSSAWLYLIVEQGTSDNSRIKQTAWYDGTAGVKITYVRTLNSGTWSPWYANDNDSVTTISQTNGNVTREIENRKTGDNNTLQSSKDFTQSSITSAVKGVNSTITQTSDAILAKVGATNLFPNSEFEKDYGYRSKSGNTNLSLVTKSNIDGAYNGTVSVTSTAATYQGYWTNNIQVQGGQKYSASVKVHYTNGGISNGKALLDLWFLDSTGARISSASMSTSQVSSPFWVQLVSEGFTAPTNAVYLQMNLLVNDAGAGQVATFVQPMLTATEKLQGYTPNDDISAQLSLFKDNWSIGITDNISKITSGIVGNASQMSLISKNVTIDSPNTQIKGTAWIQSAMIANGAIGSAQIGDATITSAKIATLDVAKLTGNVSSFIQSNWNGTYGSTKITSSGMEVKTTSADAVFDAKGVTIYTAKGATALRDGGIGYLTSSNEDIGMVGTVKWGPHPNVDYLMVALHGYHTTTPGDDYYESIPGKNNAVFGGDGIGFGISNAHGNYDMLMTWDSPLVAGYQGRMSGWHVEDVFTTHLMSYAAGGLKVSSQYSEGERSLHTQGIDINSNSRWFGFVDGSGKVGFGTDQTQDVIVFIKGKPYSMYTMLNKLGMLK